MEGNENTCWSMLWGGIHVDIRKVLAQTKYDYDIVRHDKPILTREDGAEYFGIDIGQTAPTLILKTDKGFFGLIISGSREKVDFGKLVNQLNCKKVKLASPKEVKKATGFGVGEVALIGFNLPCLMDKRLFDFDFIYGGTGESTSTLKISPRALTELNQVVGFIE